MFTQLAALALVVAMPMPARSASAQSDLVRVRQAEGGSHGYLVLRSPEGEALASGEYTATSKGERVNARLTFRFKDGSIDDEATVFTQRERFRLLSDWHEQKGPRFPHPFEMKIDAASGQVTVHHNDGTTPKEEVYHLDLPEDVANGMLLTLIKNFDPGSPEMKASMVILTPKPRVVTIAVTPDGEEGYRAGGARYGSLQYAVKVQLGGMLGMVAPIIGKEPRVDHVWISKGAAPTILRLEAQFYQDGPLWKVELASPVWR